LPARVLTGAARGRRQVHRQRRARILRGDV